MLKRTNLIDLFDTLVNNPIEEFEELLPWLIESIFANGMAHSLDGVFETCTRLMGSTIYRILSSNRSEPQKEEMLTQCLKFMKQGLQIVSRHGSKYANDAVSNRALFIKVFHLKPLIESSLLSDNIEVNLLAL